jgi:acetyl-CoA C-acetyltransferase
MNAIMEVDQGAAAIVMAACDADRLGIPEERRVAFLGGGRSVDGWSVSVRASLSRSPAYEAAAAEAAGHAGVGPQAVDVFDLYSCFPSAVELAMNALGVAADDPRPLTCTGGLAHHGGPGNAYSLHGVANMVDTLRNGPGRVGWVSGLGMTATKHAICVLTSDPARHPASDGRATEVALPDALRDGPECVAQPDGNAEVESYTVLFGRDNEPNRSVFLLRLEDGRRALANGEPEREALLQLTHEEGVGLRGKVHAGGEGTPNTFTPS